MGNNFVLQCWTSKNDLKLNLHTSFFHVCYCRLIVHLCDIRLTHCRKRRERSVSSQFTVKTNGTKHILSWLYECFIASSIFFLLLEKKNDILQRKSNQINSILFLKKEKGKPYSTKKNFSLLCFALLHINIHQVQFFFCAYWIKVNFKKKKCARRQINRTYCFSLFYLL